ncbi:hypothetical protein [Campylobacter lari]|uniref:Uncharacterized protein n=2 Tax=Campylobacter lari TaxID=201 RepID=A0A0A8HUW6_CAMLA|nr:hypothetical protein [Campylobacter lari]AJD01523.1 hypothetical protein UPTC3659_0671 [Campylobacter lari NCTC 11845]EAK9953815.1 hypothetical protein [Campylobacter lari]
MAYYNPQQVVFNPSLGVIQNAGKVGGVLYDSMKQYREEENKRRLLAQRDEELKARQEQNEINNAFLNNNLLQKERAFEYAMEQDRIKNNLALQEFNSQSFYRDINNQKTLLEMQRIENEINAKKQEQKLFDNITNSNTTRQNFTEKQHLGDIRTKAAAQFLDMASNRGKTYDTTHGFWNGAVNRFFGGWGSKSTDLNSASDLFLQRVLTDLMRGGKNAKWNLENLQANFPINGNILEANNQKVAQDLVGEWLAYAPTAYSLELSEKLGNAKTNFQKQTAIEEYQNNMAFYNEYAPKVRAFYWDEKYDKPSKKAITVENQKTKEAPQNSHNLLAFANNQKFYDVNLGGFEAQISEPDSNGNVILINSAGKRKQVSLEELRKEGLVK